MHQQVELQSLKIQPPFCSNIEITWDDCQKLNTQLVLRMYTIKKQPIIGISSAYPICFFMWLNKYSFLVSLVFRKLMEFTFVFLLKQISDELASWSRDQVCLVPFPQLFSFKNNANKLNLTIFLLRISLYDLILIMLLNGEMLSFLILLYLDDKK